MTPLPSVGGRASEKHPTGASLLPCSGQMHTQTGGRSKSLGVHGHTPGSAFH